jgi:hypothetical protein
VAWYRYAQKIATFRVDGRLRILSLTGRERYAIEDRITWAFELS